MEVADRLWPGGGGDHPSKELKGKSCLGLGYIAPNGAYANLYGFAMNIPLLKEL
jgi:hypothetical protein